MKTPIHLARVIPAVAAILWLGGCTWLQQQWPWREKQVPVTQPREQVRLPEAAPATQPAGATQSVAAAQPASSTQPTAVAMTGPVAVATVPPTVPGTAQPVAPRDPSGPTRLTDLAPASPGAVEPNWLSPLSRPVEIVSTLGLQVNNKYITVEDILRSSAGELAELPSGLSERQFRERAVRILGETIRGQIEQAAILPEAEAKMTDEQTKQIDSEMDKTLRAMVAEAGGSRKKLEEIWVQRGTTLDQVLRDQRRKLILSRYWHVKIMENISITRKMLYDYYLRNKAAQFTQGKKVQMETLAVPFAAFVKRIPPSDAELAGAKAAARQAIETAEKAARLDPNLAEAVKAMALDGNAAAVRTWPLMAAGSFRETKVEEAAFALEEGNVSGIVETETAYYLVKVLKVEGGKVTSFEDAQEEIEKVLVDEQVRRFREKLIVAKAPTLDRSSRLEDVALEKAVGRYWKK